MSALLQSKLDYGNFVSVGLPAYLQRWLQSVLNTAARLIFRFRRYDHVSDALVMHWLCLPEQVNFNFKLVLMAYRVLNGMASWYLNQLVPVCQVVAVCSRRSRCSCTSRRTVCQQPTGRRSFPVAAFIFWNTLRLPDDVQSAPSVSTAKDILVSPVLSWHYTLCGIRNCTLLIGTITLQNYAILW